jgi:hypothetical protein
VDEAQRREYEPVMRASLRLMDLGREPTAEELEATCKELTRAFSTETL